MLLYLHCAHCRTRTELCKHLVAVDIEQKRDLDVFFPAGNTAALLIYENFLSEILQHLAVGILIVQHDFDSSDAKHVRDPECALMPPAPQLFRIAQVLYTDRCAFMLRYIHKYCIMYLVFSNCLLNNNGFPVLWLNNCSLNSFPVQQNALLVLI